MRRMLDFLAPLGLLVIAGASLAVRNGADLPGGLRPWVIAGSGLVLAHLVLRWEDIARSVGRRQLLYGSNTTVFTLAVIAILAGLNYLAYRRPLKKDFTKDQRYSLSDQTKKLVSGLQDEVRILYFQREADARGAGVDRVKELATFSPNLKVEFIDPVVRPAPAREYEVRVVPTIVVVRGARQEKIQNDSEQDLANAILKVTREAKKTVCFVHGQGERDLEDFSPAGMSGLKSALEQSQYQTKKVLLAREGKVPADCSVLVVPGPQKDLPAPVLDGLRAFVKDGGKLLALIDPVFKEPTAGYAALLKEWNLEAGNDIIVDISLQSQVSGYGPETPLAASYPYHEITKDFRFATIYHTARSLKAGSAGTAGVTAQTLVETAEDSWAETSAVTEGAVKFDEGKDTKGPVPLGAVATIPVAEPSPAPAPSPSPSPSPAAEAKPRREGRVVAFGDSDFASNQMLGIMANRDLALNTIAWLSEDPDLISIRPKEPEDQRMFLTRGQQQNVAILALLLLPGLFVALGVWNWWQRR
ncbi:MAG TPA: Gldg family protein [Vicinamibacteria bacterium]|nr:Gldg family protein [Vicinamibacteria bacterium]